MYVSMLAISVLLFTVASVVYLRHPAASAFHPATFYLAFHGLVFVVRPLFAWYYAYDNMYEAIVFRPSQWEKTLALICTNVAFVVFMAVALRFAREPFAFPRANDDEGERRQLLRRFWLIAIPLGAIGVYSLLWQWNEIASGRDFVVVDDEAETVLLTGASGYFIAVGMTLAPITAVIAYLGRFRWWSLVPFAAFSVLRLGTGSRTDFVIAAVMIGILLLIHLRKKWPTPLLILGALAVVMVFDGLQESRGAIIRETLRPDVVDKGHEWRPEEAPLESMDIANIEFMEFMVWAVPTRTGTYDYFLNNLQIVTEPIPRALWPEKPVGAPIKRFDLHPPGTYPVGESFSVPGMGWYNAGLAGVIVWSALFALIYAAGYRWAVRHPSNLAALAYAVFLSTTVLAYRDGTLLTLVRLSAIYLAPIAALAALARAGPLKRKALPD